jgi:hypothetical protein
MPIHPHLEAVSLDVAYRASAEPQLLDVRVKLSGPAEAPLAPWAIGTLVECINRGLAGGAELAPSLGSAALEAGPTGEGPPAAGELGPEYAFRLSVAGVSPRFLRVIVENLAACGGRASRVLGISIVGALPPDGSPLSAREREVSAWLEDPDAYPGTFRDPGFPVALRAVPRGAALRVTLASKTTDVAAPALEDLFSSWQSAVLTYPNATRTARGLMDPHGTFARTRTDFFAKVTLFDHARGPCRAALVTALARFHATVTPIASAEIAMP